jgi:hypothetical protein
MVDSLKHARHAVSYFRERGIKNGVSVFMQTKASAHTRNAPAITARSVWRCVVALTCCVCCYVRHMLSA